MKYSKKESCFFSEKINYKKLPDDLVSMDEVEYANAINHINNGGLLDVKGGRVFLVDIKKKIDGYFLVENSINHIDILHATVLEDLTGRKTDTEKLTWKSKEEAAIEFVTGVYQSALDQLSDDLDDNKPDLSETERAQAQHIVANHAIIADAVTGESDDTVEREAQAILAKAAGYKKMVGVAEKLKSAAKAGIRALDPESETIQQDVDAVLDAVKAKAEAVKQQVKQELQEGKL